MHVASRNWKRPGTDSPLDIPEGTQHCQHLDFSPWGMVVGFSPPKLGKRQHQWDHCSSLRHRWAFVCFLRWLLLIPLSLNHSSKNPGPPSMNLHCPYLDFCTLNLTFCLPACHRALPNFLLSPDVMVMN